MENFGITYSEDERLNVCPFCKSKAWLRHIEYDDGDVWYVPECSECNCGWQAILETKEEAINEWNKRQ